MSYSDKTKFTFGLSFIALLLFGVATFDYSIALDNAYATGTWGGGPVGDNDMLHAPIAWCIYENTPVLDGSITIGSDSTTDEKLWRRHERPTNEIYDDQAGISFRSNIMDNFNNPALTFPTIDDNVPTDFGEVGDMRGEDVNLFGAEFDQSLIDCVAAWTDTGTEFANVGITTVNVGLFHDTTDYVGIGGWGACAKIGTDCITPYDGFLVIIDNVYLHPSSPDRTWPDGSGRQFGVMDEFGIVVGHELGHALGLGHRNTSTENLMHEMAQDNDGDNILDNTDLNQNEVDDARLNVVRVTGFERDPPNQFISGDFIAAKHTEKIDERKEIPSYLDISILKLTLDTKNNELSITQQLRGLIPETNKENLVFVTLMDSDNNKSTGSKVQDLGGVKIEGVEFVGADFVIVAVYDGKKATASVFEFTDRLFVARNPEDGFFRADLATFEAWPYYLPVENTRTGKVFPIPEHAESVPVFNLMIVTLDNDITNIVLDKPLVMQSFTGILSADEIKIVDKFDNTDNGVTYTVSNPNFPHCFPDRNEVVAGENITVKADGLLPNHGTHLIFGVDVAATGQTDSEGNITLEFSTSPDMEPGNELITIGSDGTALTADCTINIVEKKIIPTDQFPWWYWIIIIILVAVIIILVVLRILHK